MLKIIWVFKLEEKPKKKTEDSYGEWFAVDITRCQRLFAFLIGLMLLKIKFGLFNHKSTRLQRPKPQAISQRIKTEMVWILKYEPHLQQPKRLTQQD